MLCADILYETASYLDPISLRRMMAVSKEFYEAAARMVDTLKLRDYRFILSGGSIVMFFNDGNALSRKYYDAYYSAERYNNAKILISGNIKVVIWRNQELYYGPSCCGIYYRLGYNIISLSDAKSHYRSIYYDPKGRYIICTDAGLCHELRSYPNNMYIHRHIILTKTIKISYDERINKNIMCVDLCNITTNHVEKLPDISCFACNDTICIVTDNRVEAHKIESTIRVSDLFFETDQLGANFIKNSPATISPAPSHCFESWNVSPKMNTAANDSMRADIPSQSKLTCNILDRVIDFTKKIMTAM